MDFTRNIIVKGYAEKVIPPKELDRNDGKVWYIPYHGVHHPRRPGKLRVVFDCTATYDRVSQGAFAWTGPYKQPVWSSATFQRGKVAIFSGIEQCSTKSEYQRRTQTALGFCGGLMAK